MNSEEQVLQSYSSPGLKRNQLSREAKRDHLASLKVTKSDREKILSELYGHEDSELHISEHVADATRYFASVERSGNTVIIKPTLNELASHAAGPTAAT